MAESGESTIQVTCPCCKSTLLVDPRAGTVKEWKEAKDPRKTAGLKDALKLLAGEKGPGESGHQEVSRSDREKGATRDKKSKDSREKSQDEPPAKQLPDVDLD